MHIPSEIQSYIVSFLPSLSYRETCKLWSNFPVPIAVIKNFRVPGSKLPIPKTPFVISFIRSLPPLEKEKLLFACNDPEMFPFSSFEYIKECESPDISILDPSTLIWDTKATKYLHVINEGMKCRFAYFLVDKICKASREKNKKSEDKAIFFIKEYCKVKHCKSYLAREYNSSHAAFNRSSKMRDTVILKCLHHIDMTCDKFCELLSTGKTDILDKYCDIGFPSGSCSLLTGFGNWKTYLSAYSRKGEGDDLYHKFFYYVFKYQKVFSWKLSESALAMTFLKQLETYKGKMPENIKCHFEIEE